MADFNYTGTGGARISGCADTKSIKYLPVSFQIGDSVYVYDSARKGFLERVVIKEITAVRNRATFYQYLVKYKDTWNRIYFEGDLVDEYDALSAIKAFLERREADFNSIPHC